MKLNFDIPMILGRNHTSYLLIAIQNHPNVNQWMCQNCIQVELEENDDLFSLSFVDGIISNNIVDQYNPLLSLDSFSCGNNSQAFIIAERYLIPIFKDKLDSGYFVYLHLDDYYIPDKPSYQRSHFTHNNFIYGYNNNEKKFLSYGYDVKGICRHMDIPFSCVISGYQYSERKTIWFAKSNLYNSYDIDLEYLKDNLQCYIEPKKIGELVNQKKRLNNNVLAYRMNNLEVLFGYEAERHILNEIKEATKNGEYPKHLFRDMRTYQILIEHRVCMEWRLNYLSTIGLLDKDYGKKYSENVLAPSMPIKNMMLKNWVHQDINPIIKVVKIWEQTMEEEADILSHVISEL